MKNTAARSRRPRPLSPHITIYRWPLTMVISIMHRLTGGGLYFGTIFLVIWLVAVASGEHVFSYINAICTSTPGRFVLFFYTLALTQHLVGGTRHLFWDITPTFLEKERANKVACVTIFISIILTLIIWITVFVLASRG